MKDNLMQGSGRLFSTERTSWYWITIGLALATSIAILIPANLYPLVYLRYSLAMILLMFLPGYTFLRALNTVSAISENPSIIERSALSIGLSLALLSIIGLILNYTPWRITEIPITLSLTFLTITFSLASLAGERRSQKRAANSLGNGSKQQNDCKVSK